MYYHYHHGTRWQIVQGYLSCGCFPDCWKTALVRELLNRRNLVRLTFIGWLASGHPLVICLSSWMRKAPRNTLDIIQDWSWYSYMKEAGTKDCIITILYDRKHHIINVVLLSCLGNFYSYQLIPSLGVSKHSWKYTDLESTVMCQ